MDPKFLAFTESLQPKFDALMNSKPITLGDLPPAGRGSGIYVFSENGMPLYVGRTRNVGSRYRQHTGLNSKQNKAAFAFKLAREASGYLKSTYKAGDTTRDNLMKNSSFLDAFNAALSRIRAMEFRFVEEADPTRQCLLEIYVSVVCGSPYNDFDTH